MAVALFLGFAFVLLMLPSRHYMSVDGSLRSTVALREPRLVLHGNNHMLYPLWIRVWAQLTSAVGIRAKDDFGRMRISEAMNSVLAAAIVAMLYSLLRRLADRRVALLCTLLYGLSTAFLLHATNAAEPVVGLFFAVWGIILVVNALERDSAARLIAAGLSFALALASYQGVAVVAGPAAFACFAWASAASQRRQILRFSLARIAWIAVGGVIGICAIYGPAYAYEGVPVRSMPLRFLSLVNGAEVYGGFGMSKIVNVPFGLILNLYQGVPSDYAGIRSLRMEPHWVFWIVSVALSLGFIAWMTFLIGAGLRSWIRHTPASVIAVAVAGFAFVLFPLVYWGPLYDKLWLVPLAGLACILAISLHSRDLLPEQRTLLDRLLLVVLLLEIVLNLPQVVIRHTTAAPHLSDAESIARLISPNDWVVVGFDDVSSLWLTFWGYNTNYLVLPSSTLESATAWLNSAKQHCIAGDGRMLFIGVLDQDKKAWDEFLGHRVGIPFNLLNEYRKAQILRAVPFGKSVLTLREYGACTSLAVQR